MQLNQSLINACKQGEQKAYYALYKVCFADLMTVCMRYYRNKEEAGPILNKAFLQITKNLDKYNEEKPFIPWIKRIMIHTIINEYHATKRAKSVFVATDFSASPIDFDGYSFNEVFEQIDVAHIRSLIHQLPDLQKQVFNLYAVDGYTHKEIAELLTVPVGTSKWLLSEARKKLKVWVMNSMQIKGVNAI
jgi:RNA polymerase sigma-70 factor (ECF subfamily)